MKDLALCAPESCVGMAGDVAKWSRSILTMFRNLAREVSVEGRRKMAWEFDLGDDHNSMINLAVLLQRE